MTHVWVPGGGFPFVNADSDGTTAAILDATRHNRRFRAESLALTTGVWRV